MGFIYKSFMLSCLLLVCSKEADSESGATSRYYLVDIDGHRYAIDDTEYKTRPEAKDFCTSLDLELIRFDTIDRWESIQAWITDNNYRGSPFWTGALRNADSTQWIWDQTGAQISQFHWAEFQPDVEQDRPACVSFHIDQGGWSDEDCVSRKILTMCQ